jgi:branched-subunit amino acid transport protein
MNEVVLISGMAAVTFAVRYPVMALVGRLQLPPLVLRALQYVPVAVLTAIIIPEMVFRDGQIQFALPNAYLFGGLFAMLVAWYTKNLLATIVLGMVFFFLWRHFFGI